jgi:hypothetical protein
MSGLSIAWGQWLGQSLCGGRLIRVISLASWSPCDARHYLMAGAGVYHSDSPKEFAFLLDQAGAEAARSLLESNAHQEGRTFPKRFRLPLLAATVWLHDGAKSHPHARH